MGESATPEQGGRTQKQERGERFARIAFVAGATVLVFLVAFGWGYATGKFKSFPYAQIRMLMDGAQSLVRIVQVEWTAERSAHEILAPGYEGGVTVETDRADTSDLLVTRYVDGGFAAQIMDRDGSVLHEWRLPPGRYAEAGDTGVSLSDRNLEFSDVRLCDDGSVVLVVAERAVVKLGRDSEVVWDVRIPDHSLHHAVASDVDGSIWTLTSRRVTNPEDWIPRAAASYKDDGVLRISPEGEILEQFSLLDVILNNDYEGVLYAIVQGAAALPGADPLHANDIDVITESQARRIADVNAGDLMVSLRNLRTILVIDRTTHEIKWSTTGPFIGHHDPEVTRDGLVLVYDNRMADGQVGGEREYLPEGEEFGPSRLIALDPVTREIVWEYRGTEEEPFFSSIQGSVEELSNGNILATEPEGGRIFEVDRQTGDIVWEYRNVVEEDYVGRVTQALPVPGGHFDLGGS